MFKSIYIMFKGIHLPVLLSTYLSLYHLPDCLHISIYHLPDCLHTGCSLNIVFFLKNVWFFWTLPVLLQRWCSTCLVCVHTDNKGKQRKARVQNILSASLLDLLSLSLFLSCRFCLSVYRPFDRSVCLNMYLPLFYLFSIIIIFYGHMYYLHLYKLF